MVAVCTDLCAGWLLSQHILRIRKDLSITVCTWIGISNSKSLFLRSPFLTAWQHFDIFYYSYLELKAGYQAQGCLVFSERASFSPIHLWSLIHCLWRAIHPLLSGIIQIQSLPYWSEVWGLLVWWLPNPEKMDFWPDRRKSSQYWAFRVLNLKVPQGRAHEFPQPGILALLSSPLYIS